jgi:putative membrane protein
MRVSELTAVGALALALAACGHKESTDQANSAATEAPSAAPTPAPAMAMSGQDFANSAAASDAFEVASSKLAAANSQSASVKSFAEKMVKAHTDSTAKLKAAAAKASPAITPDPTLKPEQQEQLDSLKSKKGTDFDTAYIAAQIAGHEQALELLIQYATQGDVPQLKTLATNLVPIVSEHLNMAKGLKP